jgi:uncharacterized pyridoxamine 5'-phosphate oxidase family protein
MEELADALGGVFYIATTEGDQPHVRPFDGAVFDAGQLFIGTNNDKAVYQQILKNPKIEIFSMENGTVRFTAEAYPVKDAKMNKEIFDLLDKNYTETSVALNLVKITGTYTNKLGEKSNFKYNYEKSALLGEEN